MDLKKFIRTIPDFPKKGVMFKDITPLLKDKEAFRFSIKQMAEHYRNRPTDLIVSPESRGFIIGGALANELHVGFVPVRKLGKLPHATNKLVYEKEYGPDTIEIHSDAIKTNQNILIVDDLVATGGTVKATADLLIQMGAKIVGLCFLIGLSYLNYKKLLKDYDIFSLIEYQNEI